MQEGADMMTGQYEEIGQTWGCRIEDIRQTCDTAATEDGEDPDMERD